MKSKNIIPAVDKTILILELLCSAKKNLSQTEINRAAGVTATTGYRIIQTLILHHWVRKNPDNTYAPTLDTLADFLIRQSDAFFRNAGQEMLNRLSMRAKLASKLSIRRGEEQISMLRAESPEPFSVSGKTGSHFPIVEGSVGAALLCSESEEDIRRLCRSCPEELPEHNRPELVLERIQSLNQNGFVMMNAGKNRWRVDAMSIPIRKTDGTVAGAVTLLGIQDDFPPEKIAGIYETMKCEVELLQTKLKGIASSHPA